jgi:hypothetical protein
MTNKPKTPNEHIKNHFKIHLSSHPSSKENAKILKNPNFQEGQNPIGLILFFFFFSKQFIP